ncbi:hypothetical protein MmTuc01_0030 [Methanosarcina mazei Tuc01]|uniref:Uncharacterized protein n=1 Tax=Methanosarcina mazei Tuc01 TaxID=1236903 RepID=M1PZR4_METMZ|nr:hypothetical protein MmTuc01_0030 [Methanosarcina mazei Tuc01]
MSGDVFLTLSYFSLNILFPAGGLLKSTPNTFANVVEKRGTRNIHNTFKVGETKW